MLGELPIGAGAMSPLKPPVCHWIVLSLKGGSNVETFNSATSLKGKPELLSEIPAFNDIFPRKIYL